MALVLILLAHLLLVWVRDAEISVLRGTRSPCCAASIGGPAYTSTATINPIGWWWLNSLIGGLAIQYAETMASSVLGFLPTSRVGAEIRPAALFRG